jgi:DNA (cytosine-5)-methyltransferase 1
MSRAYYNEFDPYAAEWLRNLIVAGHIAPGDVDSRSIEDVRPSDLAGYTQCHFFAGIGVWSYALRRAGWSDSRPVWTGSCPCQPFSAAGKGNGFDDERHLWPAWFHLISQCQPPRIYGEQVASSDGLGWLDVVQADLEAAGYARGAVDLCAAGVGAPHIRQRLWFVADTASNRWEREGSRPTVQTGRQAGPNERGVVSGGRFGEVRPIAAASELSGLADANGGTDRREREVVTRADVRGLAAGNGGSSAVRGQPGPVNGYWRDADWLLCRDGKWRAVEPGTFPLANGAPARVGRLRAYGNAINAEAAEAIIRATI